MSLSLLLIEFINDSLKDLLLRFVLQLMWFWNFGLIKIYHEYGFHEYFGHCYFDIYRQTLQKYLKQQVWTWNAHQPRIGLNWEGNGSNTFKATRLKKHLRMTSFFQDFGYIWPMYTERPFGKRLAFWNVIKERHLFCLHYNSRVNAVLTLKHKIRFHRKSQLNLMDLKTFSLNFLKFSFFYKKGPRYTLNAQKSPLILDWKHI